jgi:hypothetical protein
MPARRSLFRDGWMHVASSPTDHRGADFADEQPGEEVAMAPSSSGRAAAVEPSRYAPPVRLLLAAVVLGLGWLLAWAPAAAGQALAVLVSGADAMQAERGPRPRRLAAALLLGTAALAWLVVLPAQVRAQGSTVLVTRVDGTITPVIADHLADGVVAADRDGHAAYLVELDTPGGLDTSMREIIKAFLGAHVPVVV